MRDFLKNIYNVNVDQILTAVMNEYTDYRHTGENKMVNRDTLLAIFSDARVSAPVVKTASLHAEGKEPNQAYLYVFRHVTKKGYYPQVILTFDLHLPYHHSSSLNFQHLGITLQKMSRGTQFVCLEHLPRPMYYNLCSC